MAVVFVDKGRDLGAALRKLKKISGTTKSPNRMENFHQKKSEKKRRSKKAAIARFKKAMLRELHKRLGRTASRRRG